MTCICQCFAFDCIWEFEECSYLDFALVSPFPCPVITSASCVSICLKRHRCRRRDRQSEANKEGNGKNVYRGMHGHTIRSNTLHLVTMVVS